MKIAVGADKNILLDACDYEWAAKFKWYIGSHGYAVRTLPKTGSKKILLHRELINPPEGYEVDHINGDKLDNRRENLRVATSSQNKMNRPAQANGTSGYKGVTWHNLRNKWYAQIKSGNKKLSLGLHADIKDAALAYNIAALKMHGEFAYLNEVKQ